MENKRTCRIDMRLLPIKIHYFLAFGALGGIVPYLPVLAKSLNIHATAVGIIYTVIPFVVLLSKPLYGSISDHFRSKRKVTIVILIYVAIAYMFILLIPPIKFDQQGALASIKCQDPYSNSTLPVHYDSKCLSTKLHQGVLCHLVGNCSQASEEIFVVDGDGLCSDDMDINITAAINATSEIKLAVCRSFNGTNSSSQSSSNNSTCSCLFSNHLSLNCTPSIDSCVVQSSKEEESSEVYHSFQFWMFLLLALIGNSGSAAVYTLSDAACYELLGDRVHLYGRQRLFATISWGAVALLTGYFNDLATSISGSPNYSPGFYLMIVMAISDIFILWKVIDLKQSTYSQSIWKDIGSLFTSCRVVAFATAVVIIGGLTSLLWNYQFWYLQNLGASQLLLGLTITVQCLAAEVPFFFFSGWIIERLGHSLCLILTFVTFAIRYFLYYLLIDPWYTLPIEILHGWTFGVFYSTMTSYASHCAPPGTEATMQGILGGLFEGLGLAIGSLLSGVGFDQLGGRFTFLAASIVSALSAISFSFVTLVLKKQYSRR